MYVGSLAGGTYLRYTVLMSPKKGEPADHCCDPALSVLVMLVARNVFYVVSALQSVVCPYFSAGQEDSSNLLKGNNLQSKFNINLAKNDLLGNSLR